MNIVAISGSLRKDSFNTALLRAMQSLAPSDMQITIADISGLPLYSQDAEASFPPAAQVLKELRVDDERLASAELDALAVPAFLRRLVVAS